MPDDINDGTFIIPEGITQIGKYAFEGCSNLVEMTIPAKVIVEDYAFYGCKHLVKLRIGEGVKIGDCAFDTAHDLESVMISSQVKLGQCAFMINKKLKQLSISSNVSIGEYAFSLCQALTKLELGNNVILENRAFSGCNSLKMVTIGRDVRLAKHAFIECSNLNVLQFKAPTREIYNQILGYLPNYLKDKAVWFELVSEIAHAKQTAYQAVINEPKLFEFFAYYNDFNLPVEIFSLINEQNPELKAMIWQHMNKVSEPVDLLEIDEYRSQLRKSVNNFKRAQIVKVDSLIRSSCIRKLKGYALFLERLIDEKQRAEPIFFQENKKLINLKRKELRTLLKMIGWLGDDKSINFSEVEIEMLGEGLKGEILRAHNVVLENLEVVQKTSDTITRLSL